MRDPRLDRLADVLVRYSTKVKQGDLVCIASDPVGMPLIEATYEAVLRAGGHPYWMSRSDALNEALLSRGSDEQLTYVSPVEMHRVKTIDVHIGFWAETNTRSLSSVDPKRVATHQSARKPTFKVFMERAALAAAGKPGGLRWVGTLFPTLASAQDAEMSLRAYEEFVFRAGLLHTSDPVAEWEKIHSRQERVCQYLQKKKELHLFVPAHAGHDGTDLRVDVSKSTWINCAGQENFPDGEVFAGPQGADGHINFTFPAVYQGREVEGVRLRFKAGRVVDAAARKNEKFLIDMLDQDAGARAMGEIAIGTNYAITEFTKNTLFDEKLGGTIHMAVGAGYPESGNSNESGLHWDMVCEMRKSALKGEGGCPGGVITADGETFHKDGKFIFGAGWPGNP